MSQYYSIQQKLITIFKKIKIVVKTFFIVMTYFFIMEYFIWEKNIFVLKRL